MTKFPDLDRTDLDILRLLQKDARILNKQLSAAVGLAPSSCHERVKRLWASGLITGTEALIDPARLGYSLSAVIFVNISKAGQLRIDALMDELINVPEIRDVYLVTGQYDLIVSLVARDMDHLKQITYTALTGRSEITRYETSVAYTHRRGRVEIGTA